MEEWKTMFEAARLLNISKGLVRYHRSKLSDKDIKVRDGVTYISPGGIEEIRGYLRKTDPDVSFQELILEELKSIKNLLLSNVIPTEKDSKQVVLAFLDYLENEETILEVLLELSGESKATKEAKVYEALIDYLEDSMDSMDDFFG